MTKTIRILLFVVATFYGVTTFAAIVPRLQKGESLNICAIGTSLTDAAAYPPNWFAQTGAWLSSTYPGQVTLSDRAVAGAASSTVPPLPRGGFLQLADVLQYDNPDAVFIEFAINDAETGLNISVNKSKSNLQAMINSINSFATTHHKQVDIVVCTMNNTPYYEQIDRPNLAAYYQGYRNVAATNGLLLIDNYPNWVKLYHDTPTLWNYYVPDHIHPTSEGATAIILPEVEKTLMSQVPEPSTLVLLAVCGLAFAGKTFILNRRHLNA
jgi:lysophospholipase L1-like esterase